VSFRGCLAQFLSRPGRGGWSRGGIRAVAWFVAVAKYRYRKLAAMSRCLPELLASGLQKEQVEENMYRVYGGEP
jgi:hypothetical protein